MTRLGGTRIFFGHQSVGENIMQGVRALAARSATAGLRVVDLREPETLDGSWFAHGRIGRNGDPAGKTDAFRQTLAGGLGRQVDIALHKYCYADIAADTDVDQLFDHYRRVMGELRSAFPRVVFMHVTTPLMRVQAGPRAWVKKAIGRAPDHYEANIRRERYNDLLRREYAGREPLFDLAALESTYPDGRRLEIGFGGASGRALVPEYTTDGGHLNELAQAYVAGQLLARLSELAGSATSAQGQ
jgi:hypothetical protein